MPSAWRRIWRRAGRADAQHSCESRQPVPRRWRACMADMGCKQQLHSCLQAPGGCLAYKAGSVVQAVCPAGRLLPKPHLTQRPRRGPAARPAWERARWAARHQPHRASQHRPRRAALHRPRRASQHPPREAAQHRPRRAAQHRPRRALQHRPRRAAWHLPRRAAQNQCRQAAQHQHRPASLHRPRRALQRRPRRAPQRRRRRAAQRRPRCRHARAPATAARAACRARARARQAPGWHRRRCARSAATAAGALGAAAPPSRPTQAPPAAARTRGASQPGLWLAATRGPRPGAHAAPWRRGTASGARAAVPAHREAGTHGLRVAGTAAASRTQPPGSAEVDPLDEPGRARPAAHAQVGRLAARRGGEDECGLAGAPYPP